MSAALQQAAVPMDACIRSHHVPWGERQRVEVKADGTWGVVTDYRVLRGAAVSFRVKLDRGEACWFWADAVLFGPAPAGRPALVCLPGGRT